MTRSLELSRLAIRLPAAKAVFSWSSDSPALKVTVSAGRPVVAPNEIVSPLLIVVPSTRLAAVAVAPRAVEVTDDLVEKPVGCCNTWLAIDLAVSTSLESEVMPVLAACRTCTPLPMLSSRLEMSLARASRPAAVKKLVGLSSALLTFLPVARRPCVVASRSAVPCRESRFWRTAAERVMLDKDMEQPFWRYATVGLLGRTPDLRKEMINEI